MSRSLSPEVKAARYKARAASRFFDKVRQDEPDGCWLWTATIDRHGYGIFWLLGAKRGAHRVAYEWFRGPIPSGLDLDHRCRVRNCVNPWHLEPATRRENTLRGAAPTALTYQMNRCKKGHEFTAANTIVKCGDPRKRQCRTCQNAANRARYASKRAS